MTKDEERRGLARGVFAMLDARGDQDKTGILVAKYDIYYDIEKDEAGKHGDDYELVPEKWQSVRVEFPYAA
jgi:hypothetical protein